MRLLCPRQTRCGAAGKGRLLSALDGATARGCLARRSCRSCGRSARAKISISGIAQNASAIRSNCYRRFDSKDGIVRYGLTGIMAESLASNRKLKTQSCRTYLLQMLDTSHERRDDLLAIHENGISRLLLDVTR